MTSRRVLLLIFGGVVLLQLAVPVQMITQRELALSKGTQYRFRTAPVDPYDAFRGRFVALGVEPQRVSVPVSDDWQRHQPAYAELAVGEDGFATVSAVHREPPADVDYLRLRAGYQSGTNLHLRYPFDRYYMNEHDAPAAERVYWRSRTGTNRLASILVRVRRGQGVIESLQIEGKPIEDVLAELAEAEAEK